MSDIAKGNYTRVEVKNLEEMLTALELNYFLQMVATTCDPDMTVTEDDEIWTFKFSTIYSEFEMTFSVGKPFDITTPDGREVTCTATLEDYKFLRHCTDLCFKSKQLMHC